MGDSAEEIRHHIKGYFLVYLALMVLTGVTVGVSYFHLAIHWAVLVAFIVAAVKGGLVAAIFMHLNNEKKIIYWILILTAVLAVGFIIPVLMDVEISAYTQRHIPQ